MHLPTPMTDPKAIKPFVDRESISGFAFTGDGQLLVTTSLEDGSGATTVYAHSLRDFTFAVPKLRGSGQSADNGFSFAWAGASGDGRIAVLRSLGDSRSYQAGAGKWAQITESIGSVGSLTSTIATPLLDETGSRIVIEEQNPGSFAGDWGVFDGTFVRRGYAGIAGESIAMSRSGHRLYVLANDFASSPNCSVRAVDLDSPPLTGAGSYPEIVSGGFPIARACQNGIVDRSLAAIAPDDRTLFVAGGLGVSVIPLP